MTPQLEAVTESHADLLVAEVAMMLLRVDPEQLRRFGRAVFRFGYNYVPPFQRLTDAPPLFFAEGLCALADHEAVTINYYATGSAVSPHVDSATFEDPIHILSLLSDCDMTFFGGDGEPVDVTVPRRSLLTMDGTKRKHAIEAMTAPRISVVYRKLK